ncbi:MAG: ribonuclease [Clostridiales bacterium]|jgi:ribonuclease-3|nr:ribonuclease [Clostridiales bacterium]
MVGKEALDKIQKIIEYKFNDEKILLQALTHSSFANEKKLGKLGSNERIEFLGDAVLELVTSRYLYINYETQAEGELTRLRASLVCEYTLAKCAKSLSLGRFLFLSKGEEATEGRNRDSVLSDTFEAVIGAIYLDGGYEPAERFVIKNLLTDIESKKLFYDSKTVLQEMIQGISKEPINYVLIDEFGPDHNKTFVTEIHFENQIIGQGIGHTKKSSEQEAAYRAILTLKKKEKIQ